MNEPFPKISYLTIVNKSRIPKIDKLPTFINENKLYRLKYMVMKGRTLSPYGYSYHYIPQSVPLSFNTGNTLRFVHLNNSSFKIRNNKTSLSVLIKITLQYLSFLENQQISSAMLGRIVSLLMFCLVSH